MSRDASIILAFGDGEHKFRLAIGQLRELMENCNKPRVAIGAPVVGPMSLLNLITVQDGWPDDIREIIRLGLIGGGMKPIDALALVKRYVDERPLVEAAPVAQMALLTALVGCPEEQVGKKKPKKPRTDSVFPNFTESEPQ